MPSVPLYAPLTRALPDNSNISTIPQLLQTPGGLAIMELQGHINAPSPMDSSVATPIGRLVFPEYDAILNDTTRTGAIPEGAWMHKVYFYIGHQRMLGQVKKLAKPLAIVGRKNVLDNGVDVEMQGDNDGEQLQILDIVRWKILFNSRPEPVGEGEND